MKTTYSVVVVGKKFLNGPDVAYEFSGTIKTERRESLFALIRGMLHGIEDDIGEIDFPMEVYVDFGASKVTKRELKEWFKVDKDSKTDSVK